ncbi:MAG: T9SS type A sorting domain-containing protein [Bacteroidia bacterium]
MKNVNSKSKKGGLLYISISLLLLTLSPLISKAQQGLNDASFNKSDYKSGQGANKAVSVSAVQADNKIIIAGDFTKYNGSEANGLARLDMNGKFDKSFKVDGGADGTINSIAIQSNARIIIAGGFTTYNGHSANKIVRLKKNGTIDNSFSSGNGPNGDIFQIALQPDGKILIAGEFNEYDGHVASNLVRLNSNGSFDDTFEAVLSDTTNTLVGIHQIGLQADGKIVVAGKRQYSGNFNNGYVLIRLNANGKRDYSFKVTKGSTGDISSTVSTIKIDDNGNILLSVKMRDGGSSVPYHGYLTKVDSQGNELTTKGLFYINSINLLNDGKILACGFANIEMSQYVKKVVRLNSDLSVDSTFLFKDDKIYRGRAEANIQTASIQIDGKIVFGGNFYEINGLIANNISRLNPDGSFDQTFNQHSGFNGPVLASAEYMNKRLIVGGEFSRYNYQFKSNIVRLIENGNVDASFNTGSGTNGKVNTVAVQKNGKILIGGKFTSYNGNNCNNLARLNSNGSFDASFSEAGADGEVRKIIIDNDGKIIIAGDFENVNGVAIRTVARLNPKGTIDNSFAPSSGLYAKGYNCIISSRGKIYVAVIYETGGFSRGTDVYCLNKNGSRDSTFKIATKDFYRINTLAFNNDNKLLVGGLAIYASRFGGYPGIVAQLNLDGSYDSVFNHVDLQNALNGNVRTINVLNNDRMIIGGEFSANDFTTLNHIALLNRDGTVNEEFTGDAEGNIYTSTFVNNDKMIVAGSFTEYTGEVRNGIARISLLESEGKIRRSEILSLDKQDKILMSVYPNPASSFITVENIELGSTLRIFNAVGVQVFNQVATNTKLKIDLADFSNGFYFIVAENGSSKSTLKFIVSK